MKTDERKTLKDLQGWKPAGKAKVGLFSSFYRFYLSPDKDKLASVHLNDDEVAIIFERGNGKILYLHPVTRIGMRNAGVTEGWLEAQLKKGTA